jgi:hypothetical protein
MIARTPKVRREKPLDFTASIELEDKVRDPAFYPRTDDRYSDLAVITVHFNWSGYRRPVLNLLRFLREMDYQGIPVYGMELYLQGTEPLMARNPRWLCVEVGPENLLLQKEPMLNRIASEVPRHIPYIAAIDADIHFTNPRWAELSVRALEETPVIQPFSEAVWGDEWGRVEQVRPCTARHGLTSEWHTHPGFAWVFRREFFDQLGFYPWAVTGAGDTITATGLLDIPRFPHIYRSAGQLNLDNGVLEGWISCAKDFMEGCAAGWVEGQVWHEWHGSKQNRGYVHRHVIIEKVDVLEHVRINTKGLLEWTEAAPQDAREGLAHYFETRREDG